MNARHPESHLGLIVEDDHDIHPFAAALLEVTLLDVVEVENAEAALECLQERGGEVAMIFADIRLLGPMDRVQLAEAACTLWPTIGVVLTSGTVADELDDLPDCVTFMPKPWRAQDVLVEAETAIHQPPPVT